MGHPVWTDMTTFYEPVNEKRHLIKCQKFLSQYAFYNKHLFEHVYASKMVKLLQYLLQINTVIHVTIS